MRDINCSVLGCGLGRRMKGVGIFQKKSFNFFFQIIIFKLCEIKIYITKYKDHVEVCSKLPSSPIDSITAK